jgi:hypothetical protein
LSRESRSKFRQEQLERERSAQSKQKIKTVFRKATLPLVAVAALVTGVVAYLNSDLKRSEPADFYSWRRHEEVGTKISNSNSNLVSQLVEEANGYKKSSPGTIQWPKYNDFTKLELLDVMSDNQDCSTLAKTAFVYIKKSGMDFPTDSSRIEADAFNLTLKLLSDKGYTDYVMETTNIDCRGRSLTYIAAFIAEATHVDGGSFRIELDSGVVFSRKLQGEAGIGHQWVRSNGKVIDPSVFPERGFRLNPTDLAYTPVVGVDFEINGGNVLAYHRVYCYPAEIETNYLRR